MAEGGEVSITETHSPKPADDTSDQNADKPSLWHTPLSRRNFLRTMGIGGAALLLNSQHSFCQIWKCLF